MEKKLLNETELERLFDEWKTPAAGRKLIRRIREDGPVRQLQYRYDGVRTRYMSKKMGRPLLAESRTCEFPGIYLRDHDPETVELWPQPCKLDIEVRGPKGGATRLQHTPDLFLIEHGFIIEEWRERPRLVRLAAEHPDRFYCDEQGRWHYRQVEEYLAERGIEYRLRCSDEHPRVLLSNLQFLEDYSLETSIPVPIEEQERLVRLMQEHHKIAHLSLVHEHGFKADHVFQLVLTGDVYVNLEETALRNTGELIIYRTESVARADAILRLEQAGILPASGFQLAVGTRFELDGRQYQVEVLGNTKVHARDLQSGARALLEVQELLELHRQNMVTASGVQAVRKDVDEGALFSERRLGEALKRLEWLQNPQAAPVSERHLRRLRSRIAGITAPQDQLEALLSRNTGNTTTRLPEEAIAVAEQVIASFHNTEKKPTVQATYNKYVVLCDQVGVKGMSRAAFYRWIKEHEDVVAREGKRMAYQKAAIPLTFDYQHPVHGVLPHEICYCDHTILNVFLKGSDETDLGKPTITLMVDGALSMSRGFYLSYRPASAVSVLMCLRDYVRRNGRLPRMLVLDNGKEFHSAALLQFCSLFNINIRWRRRSRPRDSSIIERMLGATEQEVIAQLDGNSLALKDPRMVSSTHLPTKHIRWTLPGLYYAIEHFLFTVHPQRIHQRFGMAPSAYEKRLVLECGAREHVLVRYDSMLRLLTAPHSGKPTRQIDRRRGVFVDGYWYWHDKLAQARNNELAVVRVELWRARVVYVCFRDMWYIAVARDAGQLEGRHRPEIELQRREEARNRRNLAQQDKSSLENSKLRSELWDPQRWDPRLREQLSEMYLLYERLGMAEVLPEAKNAQGAMPRLGMQKGSELELVQTFELEAEAEGAKLLSAPSHKPARTVVTRAATAALAPEPETEPETVTVEQEGSGASEVDVVDDDSDYF